MCVFRRMEDFRYSCFKAGLTRTLSSATGVCSVLTAHTFCCVTHMLPHSAQRSLSERIHNYVCCLVLGKKRTGKERTREKTHYEKSADTILLTDHNYCLLRNICLI